MVKTTIPITVIIPTRERGDVLAAALANVCAQDYDGLDILVSDNCSTDRTADVVRAANDPRVRYVNTGQRLSMSHNWEFALSHVPVDDRYVMVVGDDDGLVPGALERVAALVRETKAKALNSTFVTFIWPNPDNAHMGRLLVPMRRGFEVRDSRAWLQRAVEGRAWYSDLPMLYSSGVIHMSLIDQIRRVDGTFYHSCQPDIFSSVALSSVCDRYVFSHEPFAIAGHSRHSNGASWSASGRGTTSPDALKANELFSSETNIPWHQSLPQLEGGKLPLSIDLLVYESYLQSTYLHNDPFRLTPGRMLAQFLARDISDMARLERWGALFADMHGIDMSEVRREARARRRQLMLHGLREKATAFRDLYRLEPNFGVRMRDVFEAGLVAGTILRTRPGRLRSYANTLGKRLGWQAGTRMRTQGANTVGK